MTSSKHEQYQELSGYFRSLRLDRDVSTDSNGLDASSTTEHPYVGLHAVDGNQVTGQISRASSSTTRTPGASITDEFFQQITTQAGSGSATTPATAKSSPALVPRPPTTEPPPSRPWKGGATAGASLTDETSVLGGRSARTLLPPQRPEHRGRNVLVLDLDETLVHSSSHRKSYDSTSEDDIALQLLLDGKRCEVFVKLRPHVRYFLAEVGSVFEVVIFTASLSKYADPLIDRLDPEGNSCHHRLFRQHCTLIDGSFVKDLTLLGRPLHKVIIIDNSPAAYLYQPRNAIPCTTWFDNRSDTELSQFVPFLKLLALAEDVYPILDAYHDLLQQQTNGQ